MQYEKIVEDMNLLLGDFWMEINGPDNFSNLIMVFIVSLDKFYSIIF